MSAGLVGCAADNPPERVVEESAKPASPVLQTGDIAERAYQLRELQRLTVMVDGHEFKVWLMDTDAKRQEGFMFVPPSSVKANEGMLFSFPDADRRNFWMQNTPMPLDVAYFGSDFKLLNAMEGKPFDESGLPSAGRAQYVLELKAGTLRGLGVKRGAKLKLPAGF